VARRHYRPEEIIGKLREAEILLAQGMKVPEVVRELGIHEVTYYRWRKQYGGMKVNQMQRLKELEKENSRLRKAVSVPNLVYAATGHEVDSVMVAGRFLMRSRRILTADETAVRRDAQEAADEVMRRVLANPDHRKLALLDAMRDGRL